jgi:hypothetical protein
MTPCGGTSVSITVGVTTWLDEDSQSPSYSSVFAPGLKSSVPMGLDTYFFSCCGSGTDMATWQNAIAWAVGYSHPTFVEEFAMPRWVQHPLFNSEANAIKGSLSCDWEPSYSHNLANFLAAVRRALRGGRQLGGGPASLLRKHPQVCTALHSTGPNRCGEHQFLGAGVAVVVGHPPSGKYDQVGRVRRERYGNSGVLRHLASGRFYQIDGLSPSPALGPSLNHAIVDHKRLREGMDHRVGRRDQYGASGSSEAAHAWKPDAVHALADARDALDETRCDGTTCGGMRYGLDLDDGIRRERGRPESEDKTKQRFHVKPPV